MFFILKGRLLTSIVWLQKLIKKSQLNFGVSSDMHQGGDR